MWRWLVGIALVLIAVISVAYGEHYGSEKNEAARQKDCIALSVSPEEKHTCEKETQSRKDYSPWWNVLLAWPVGIQNWAIIATGFVIAWQAVETRKAAEASITEMHLNTNKERAKIKVQPLSMQVNVNSGRDYWFLLSQLGIRNVGISRAYVLNGTANFKLRFDRERVNLMGFAVNNLAIVDGFIAASTPPDSPLIEDTHYVIRELTVAEQADYIFSGKVIPYIIGFIEYETAGTIFRSNFHYSWKSRGKDGGLSFMIHRMLSSHYPNTPPSDQERLCSGEWLKEVDGNEDYELKPQSAPGTLKKLKDIMDEPFMG
jgi:hypothetical protein